MRKTTLVFTVVAALILAAAAVAPGLVGAHGRQAAAGLKFVFGAIDEPIVTGQRTWIELTITDEADAPVEGLADNLTVTLVHGGHEKTLPMNAVRGTPGAYKGAVWFTEAGEYTAIARGKNLAGEPFEVSFQTRVGAASDLYTGPAPALPPAAADITLPVGSSRATVNGVEVTLDVPATIIDGRTLVPIRFVAESLGQPVHWNADTRTVHIGGQ